MNSTQQLIVQLLLSSIQAHQPMGRGTLAMILKGSKDHYILQRSLDKSDFYGALFWYTIEIIDDFLLQLVEQGYAEVIFMGKYNLPYLYVTEKGKSALIEKKFIDLQERKKKVQLKMNESVEQTFHLFKEYKSVSLVAQKRDLVERTIWQHILTLVSLSYLSIDEVLSKEIQAKILEKMEMTKDLRLKLLKEQLPEISYEELRCMLASTRIKKAI